MYYLIFVTKSIKGLEAMKEAMFRVTKSFEYKFSDRVNPHLHSLIEYDNTIWYSEAANWLYNKFKGKTVSMKDLKKCIIVESPWLFRKGIFNVLEREGKIEVIGRKKLGSYPDGCSIRFLE